MEKIKVLRIITRMNIGGPAIQAVLLSTGLDKDRFSSLLVTGSVGKNEGDMGYLAQEFGVEPLVVSELQRELNITNDIVSFFKLYRFIKKEKPDIVHTHTAKAGTIGRLAARLTGAPIIIHTFHGHIFNSYFGSLKTKFFLLVERALARITDKIIVISESQRDEIRRYLNINNDNKIVLIPLGFDLDRFRFQEDNTDKLYKGLDIPKEALVIGIVGRLTAVKNHTMFLEAAKRIKEKFSDKIIKFLIVGDGELKDELTALSNRLGLQKDVLFVGWRKDIDSLYGIMDMVTLTSSNEGTPVSLIEAFANAKAVVATDVGGVRDVVQDGKSGFVVPKNDINAFSEAISSFIYDKAKRERFGIYGRDFVKNRHSKDKLIHTIENLYCRELRRKHSKFK